MQNCFSGLLRSLLATSRFKPTAHIVTTAYIVKQMTHNGHVNEDVSSIQTPYQYAVLLNVILAKRMRLILNAV